jgi:alpha-glucosidase
VRVNVDGGLGVEYRWVEDPTRYPDLAGMIDELHARGLRFLAYVNPFVAPELPDHWDDMVAGDLLVRDATGEPYAFPSPNGTAGHPDFTKPEAHAYVQGALVDAVTRLGIDGWMADFGEWTPLDASLADGSDPRAYHNRFPIEWHRANAEAFAVSRPDGDYVTFARSGWTGVHRYSMIHWAGDQEATWSEHDGLPTVVPALLNLGIAGIPYVTLDIGGFSGGPSDKELYLRWVELGAFAPIMRTHEGNRRDENWNWDGDAETIEHFRRFAQIHEALRPELEALADEAASSGVPMVRHLMLVFPEDRDTWEISDQFLLGDGLMIAPVTEEGATSREVYFPQGAWFHVFTGERFDGPMRASVDAPIGTPPVFSRDEDRTDLRATD